MLSEAGSGAGRGTCWPTESAPLLRRKRGTVLRGYDATRPSAVNARYDTPVSQRGVYSLGSVPTQIDGQRGVHLRHGVLQNGVSVSDRCPALRGGVARVVGMIAVHIATEGVAGVLGASAGGDCGLVARPPTNTRVVRPAMGAPVSHQARKSDLHFDCGHCGAAISVTPTFMAGTVSSSSAEAVAPTSGSHHARPTLQRTSPGVKRPTVVSPRRLPQSYASTGSLHAAAHGVSVFGRFLSQVDPGLLDGGVDELLRRGGDGGLRVVGEAFEFGVRLFGGMALLDEDADRLVQR